MQKVIIENDKVRYVELTPEEEAAHLAEAEAREVEEKTYEEAALKAQLVRELVELREMKLNPDLFTADDVAEKQTIADKVTEKLEAKGVAVRGAAA